MARHKKAFKSIYEKVKSKSIAREDLTAIPVFVHGDKMSAQLHSPCERVVNVRMQRIRAAIEVLRLSAATAGSFSLSANQIGMTIAMFVMHKDLALN